MAKAGVNVGKYISIKIRLAKESSIYAEYQQLLAVWSGLDVKIRAMLDEATALTPIDRFRKAVEEDERTRKEKPLRASAGQF